MKHTRTLIALVLLATLNVVAVQAEAQGYGQGQGQGRAMRDMDPAQRAEALAEQLDLTDDQRAQVETILTEQYKKAQAMRSEHMGDRTAMREALRAHGAETHGRLAEVLTEEQMAEFDALAAERRALMQDRMRQRRQPPQ